MRSALIPLVWKTIDLLVNQRNVISFAPDLVLIEMIQLSEVQAWSEPGEFNEVAD